MVCSLMNPRIAFCAMVIPCSFSGNGVIQTSEPPTVTVSVPLSGNAVDVKIKTTRESRASTKVSGTFEIDLGDLQNKIPILLKSVRWPNDNCERLNIENVAISPRSTELNSRNGVLSLSISGFSTVWKCLENPVTTNRIVWQPNEIAPGVEAQVPIVQPLKGAPIRNKVRDQVFSLSVDVPSGRVDRKAFEALVRVTQRRLCR
jgi:hypothetical protein